MSEQILNELAEGLKTELLNLTDRIQDILSEYNVDISDDIIYVRFFFEKSTPDYLMNHVINKILPHKQQIEKRNDAFFAKNKGIFGKLPKDKVDMFSQLVLDGTFQKEDKEEIFAFFDAFVAYAEEYKKKL